MLMVAWNVANVSERVRVSHPAPKIERKSMSDLQLGVTLLLSLIIAYILVDNLPYGRGKIEK